MLRPKALREGDLVAVVAMSSGLEKEEAPLLQLRTGGTAIDISCFAEVTFYGEDQQGREVSVVGLISVDFANWGDPDL